jgi:glycosyltransferase involved in cell wall biosynthesis
LYRAIERRYLGTVDGAVCNSTTTRDIVTGLGVDPGLTAVAPPAGDQFDPDLDDGTIEHRARERPLRVVFVGNVTPRKGLKTLIEGLSAAETDVKLTVVGRSADERYAAAVRRSVRREGLADRVDLAGELSEEELETVLRSSHVLAVPSRYEGFGIVYLEGMSFGLPAIASRAGGATDVVTDGETGVLVDPGNSAAIAGALTRFDADRDRLASMGKAARRRYESHPDWRETTARVRELLEAVAALEVIP